MSRDVPPNGAPHMQNINALLGYPGDMGGPPQMQQMNGLNGNGFSNGSSNRKNDYADSGVGEYEFTW